MHNTTSWIIPFVCGMIASLSIYAQVPKTDLKEIEEALKMTEYAPDPEAAAVILKDYGIVSIEEAGGELYLRNTRYRRVKVFNESAFHLAEDGVQFKDGKVSNIKGVTYSLNGDKVESVKLSKKEILTEKLSDGFKETKFTLPQVKEGSVFEYSYMVSYEGYSYIRPWLFQSSYPVVHSEYETRIPEWFYFIPLVKGQSGRAKRTSSTFNKTMLFSYRNSRGERRTQTSPYQGTATTFVMDSVPAFVEEPFTTTAKDHISSIEFQLQSVTWPGRSTQMVMSTWDKLAEWYLEYEKFGDRIRNHRLKKYVKALPLEGKSKEEKVALIYDYVRGTMSWNDQYSDLAARPLGEVFEQKSGTSGEINLALLAMLKAADIDAYPVILSTRNHGKVQQVYPHANQFNHVIVLAGIEEGEILLDAINDFTSFGLLPRADFNGPGYLIDPGQSQWINIQPYGKQEMTIMTYLKLDSLGSLSGKVSQISKGYSAASDRSRLSRLDMDKEKYAEEYLMSDWSDAELGEISLKEETNRNAPLEVSCEFTANEYVTVSGDFMYIQPLLAWAFEENPFKLKERSYPVDFATPLRTKMILNINIPAGYVVDQMPKATKVSLPNGGGSFLYQGQAVGPMIQLMSDVSISQSVFDPEEYGTIKAYFDMIVQKQAEQIVLKKSE